MSSAAPGELPTRMTREEFRAWVLLQPRGRFERIDGEVVAMAPERMAHLRVKRDILIALVRAIGSANVACEALPDGATDPPGITITMEEIYLASATI